MSGHRFVRYEFERLPPERMLERARAFHERMDARRSVRDFSPDPVPRELIELAIRTASTAPSGAHRQPWTFVLVGDTELKREIRVAAEGEERVSYERRMSDEWLEALRPLGTDWRKPFLETVPWIVVVFEQLWAEGSDGTRRKNYYVRESVGIACGIFIAALHAMGLATLTHTPSPMGFLSEILGRPRNESLSSSSRSAIRARTRGCRTCDASRSRMSSSSAPENLPRRARRQPGQLSATSSSIDSSMPSASRSASGSDSESA